MQKPAVGMSRFFSQANRDRYRKLASGAISPDEQHQLLNDLAMEMDAFKREARCCLSPTAENGCAAPALLTGIEAVEHVIWRPIPRDLP